MSGRAASSKRLQLLARATGRIPGPESLPERELGDVLDFWAKMGNMKNRRAIEMNDTLRKLRDSPSIPLPYLPTLKHAGTSPLTPRRQLQEALDAHYPYWWKTSQTQLHRSHHAPLKAKGPHFGGVTEELKAYSNGSSEPNLITSKYANNYKMWPKIGTKRHK